MTGVDSKKPLPTPDAMFSSFVYDAGGLAGARERFQLLVTDLVRVRHETANEVALPSGSDWGIDTFVGSLDGDVYVWQSKFFPTWSGESQRANVRQSFKEVMKRARDEGFKVQGWTLCIPCILPPGEQKWFDGWKARQEREHNVRIELWNGPRMRGLLMQPDAAHVRQAYFPDAAPSRAAAPLAAYDSKLLDLSGALFVKQLEEAGRIENDAAKGLFFAAEALVRDAASREDAETADALDSLHLDIHDLWETEYNGRVGSCQTDGRMDGLIEAVLSGAASMPDPEGVHLRPAHRKGIAHRVVEDGKAGWVKHWRDIMSAFRHSTHGQQEPEEAVSSSGDPSDG